MAMTKQEAAHRIRELADTIAQGSPNPTTSRELLILAISLVLDDSECSIDLSIARTAGRAMLEKAAAKRRLSRTGTKRGWLSRLFERIAGNGRNLD